jgi:hypothetical protein
MAVRLSTNFEFHERSEGLSAFESRLGVVFDDSELIKLERSWDRVEENNS